MRALVLSGGGARGAYEAGVARALLKRERYDLICGVSIGAINAALISAGSSDALERFWHDEFPGQVFKLFPHIPHLRRAVEHVTSIGGGNGWQNAMRIARAAAELRFLRELGKIHQSSLPEIEAALAAMIDFGNLRTSLIAGATNVTHGTAAAFHALIEGPELPVYRTTHSRRIEFREITEDRFVRMLLASSAMPLLFSPIELTFGDETSQYADGCIVYNSPLGLAIDSGATEITVVFVDPEPECGVELSGFAEVASSIAMLWQQRVLDYELRLAEATNQIVRLGGAAEKRELTIRHVRPRRSLDLAIMAFDDAAGIEKAFALGLEDGANAPVQSVEPPAPEALPAPPPIWRRLRKRWIAGGGTEQTA